MKKSMDKKMAVELLKKGRTHVKGLYSKKKDSKFDADLVLGVEEGKPDSVWNFQKENKAQSEGGIGYGSFMRYVDLQNIMQPISAVHQGTG